MGQKKPKTPRERQLNDQSHLRHFIHDYKKTGTTQRLDVNACKTRSLPGGSFIVEWSTYRTPLKTLDSWGLYIMQLLSLSPFHFFASIIVPLFLFLSFSLWSFFSGLLVSYGCSSFYHYFNHQLRFEHGWVIFKLVSKASKTCYVSLEKTRDGILFQIAKNLETVRDYSKGNDRGPVAQKLGVQGILVNNIARMDLILESEALLDVLYHTLHNNCQQTVSKLLTCLAKESLDLNFHIPGLKETITINDERVVPFVEKLFPKWVDRKVQSFPEIADPFAFLVDELSQPEESDNQTVVAKQRVLNAISKLLSGDDLGFLKGRKAIFSKLCPSAFRKSLEKIEFGKDMLSSSIIEQISHVWNSSLDIVIVLEEVGAIVIHFADDSEERDHTKDV